MHSELRDYTQVSAHLYVPVVGILQYVLVVLGAQVATPLAVCPRPRPQLRQETFILRQVMAPLTANLGTGNMGDTHAGRRSLEQNVSLDGSVKTDDFHTPVS